MTDKRYHEAVNAHYTAYELAAAIAKGLEKIGKRDDVLTPEDLAPLDQFHSRGKDATVELMDLAGAAPDTRALDVGGGIGGPARLLAATHGSHVTVVDLTEDFIRVGEALTARTHQSDRVVFKRGNALELPFQPATFDLVWTQHATMNIEDKARLFRELTRVTARTGRVAMHEIVAGPAQPLHFPVPWARTQALSFLAPAEEFRAHATAAGLIERAWRDVTADTLEFFRARAGAVAAGKLPPLGLHLILGEDFPAMFANMVRNLEERRIAVIMALWTRL